MKTGLALVFIYLAIAYAAPNRNSKGKTESKGSSSNGIKSLNELYDGWKDEADVHHEVDTKDSSGNAQAGARASNHGAGFYSAEASAGVSAHKVDDNVDIASLNANADAQYGPGGAIAEANLGATIYGYNDGVMKVDVATAEVGGGVGFGTGGAKAKAEASVNLVKTNTKINKNLEANTNIGLSADTGAEFGVGGVGASFLGFGGSIGRSTGISTPIGSISFEIKPRVFKSLKFWG